MSVKRSRLSESSNFIESDLLNHMARPVESAREERSVVPLSDIRKPRKCLRPSLDEGNKEQSWTNMAVKSQAHDSISGGIGSFLNHCHYCNKKICLGEDVFMYRDYCAFCTEECRDFQIEHDEKLQKQSAESKGVIEEHDVNDLMNDSTKNQ